jgi:hypothetical protein
MTRAQPHDVSCVIHVHSTYSDGTATVAEIASAARAVSVGAVLLTDHDSREAARRGLERWHEDVLVLVGHEVTTPRGHLLAFGTEQEIDHRGIGELEICERLRCAGGFGFAAHPFSKGGKMSRTVIRPHPWSALEECIDCGIEVWSLFTDTAERWPNPAAAWRFLRDPERRLDGPPRANLDRWDRLCSVRRVPAIGGLDAHQSGIRIAGRVLSPVPNERYFRLLRTHVLLDGPLTGRFADDRAAVYEALREGRCYLALDALAPASGFDYYASAPDGRTVEMGGEAPLGQWTLRAHVPRPAQLRLLVGGRTVLETTGPELTYVVDRAGVYRVEARLPGPHGRLWVVSNPIYLRAAGQVAAEE